MSIAGRGASRLDWILLFIYIHTMLCAKAAAPAAQGGGNDPGMPGRTRPAGEEAR